MSLAALTAAGAFVDPAPITRTVTWKDVDYKVRVVRPSAYDLRKAILAHAEANKLTEVDNAMMGPLMLSVYLRFGEDGTERLTFEQAMSLDPSLYQELEKCLEDRPEPPKASRPKKKAGTS